MLTSRTLQRIHKNHLIMSRTDNYGPLSLQMSSVTGAVDDLVHGYEQLVHSLPNLTSQVANVHADTEEMAKHLEVRKLLISIDETIIY